MSFFARLLFGERKAGDVGGSAYALTFDALMGRDMKSKTGLSVTELTALRVSAVWSCCRVLCEDIGKLPLKLMREKPDGTKEVARNHPVHRVLSRRPNEWQTSMEWRMTMLLHALLAKAGYSYINRGSSGEVLELLPILPGRVKPIQAKDWTVTYEIDLGNGEKRTVPRENLHVLHGLSWDGLSALELVRQGGEAIGLAMATEETQARLHAQGARPGGTLSTDKSLTKEQIDRLKNSFDSGHGGLANSFKTVLLDNGLKWEPWTMTGVDGQHLETRQYQVVEICRLFRIFPSMVGFSDKATTYASAEAFFTAHVVHSLMPWATLWEESIERDLLTEEELRAGYQAKFSLQGLLRGDAKSRAEFYESAITKGCWMSRNEARRLEDMNPRPGLDEMLQPLNMHSGTGAPAPKTPSPAAPGGDTVPADDAPGD